MATVVMAIFTSCTSNDVLEQQLQEAGRTPITLSAYAKAQTRASEVTSIEGGFYVTAILEKENAAGAMDTTEFIPWAKYDLETGTFDGKTYYWPQEGKLTFYAYYHDAAGAQWHSLREFQAMGYTAPYLDVTGLGNVDALTAMSDAMQVTDLAADKTVQLTFGHILTKLTINAVGDDADATFELYGISTDMRDAVTYKYQDNSVSEYHGQQYSDDMSIMGNLPAALTISTDETKMTTLCDGSFFWAGKLNLYVAYKVTSKDADTGRTTTLADYTGNYIRSLQVDLTKMMGKRVNVNLTLSYDKPISFSATLDEAGYGAGSNENPGLK